jgi:threonine dehydrogenase-like Zn-dependent dehydrogenase
MTETVVDLLYSGLLRTDGLLSRTFPFDDAEQAYRFIDESPGAATKVALLYGERQSMDRGGAE